MDHIPAEVSNPYMLLGYAVVLLILFGLIGYVVNRARRLRAEIAMLESLTSAEPPHAEPGLPAAEKRYEVGSSYTS